MYLGISSCESEVAAMPEQTLQSVAFPTLSDAQIREFEAGTGAVSRSFRDGEVLIAVGDRDFKFFIVKAGEIEILDHSGERPKTVTIHRKGEFTGDVSHLTGRASIISAVARGQCEAAEVSGEALRAALNQCPTLSDIILQAFIARRQLLRESGDFVGLRVIGSRYSTDTFRVRDFMAKNRALFTWLDVETHPEVGELLQHFGLTEADTPVVALGDLLLLRNPSNRELADAIGIHQPLERTVYDLVVVGAGPAGLAAAVYGASEGLRTLLVERTAPGGQAGASMRIENYLGFPTGVTGSELAERAMLQANKFGARLSMPSQVTGLTWENAYSVLHLDGGETLTTKCLLIATGADFIRTGADVAQSPHWSSRRPPFLLETSRPGVFAAGDVRSGSAKRVAAAVGEGSMVVQFVHEVLETL
jgi:thioredoxin reductase (NADPH)